MNANGNRQDWDTGLWRRWFGRTNSGPQTSDAPALQGASCVTAAAEPRKRVLLVDDDPVTLRALSMKLEASGFEVATASDGSQAIASARDQRPDVIVLDVHFPPEGAYGGVSWDGFMIMSWLRNFEEVTNTPVVMMTSGDFLALRFRALTSGAMDLLRKPLDTVYLLRLLLLATTRGKNSLGRDPSEFEI